MRKKSFAVRWLFWGVLEWDEGRARVLDTATNPEPICLTEIFSTKSPGFTVCAASSGSRRVLGFHARGSGRKEVIGGDSQEYDKINYQPDGVGFGV